MRRRVTARNGVSLIDATAGGDREPVGDRGSRRRRHEMFASRATSNPNPHPACPASSGDREQRLLAIISEAMGKEAIREDPFGEGEPQV